MAASYEDILSKKLPGRAWTFLTAGDYATLQWGGGNPESKPTQAQLEAWRTETETALAERAAAEEKEARFIAANPGQLFAAFDTLIDVLIAIYSGLPPVQKNAIPAAVIDRAQVLRAKIQEIRNG